jgi:hypothetical protein
MNIEKKQNAAFLLIHVIVAFSRCIGHSMNHLSHDLRVTSLVVNLTLSIFVRRARVLVASLNIKTEHWDPRRESANRTQENISTFTQREKIQTPRFY